ncbi:MAG TPA: farnesyl diphosphate synthase [Thermoanaerobaculia bacterium]|nr:farnesyl diphosphate synthase [Thermoanaerobaculia bacterium]
MSGPSGGAAFREFLASLVALVEVELDRLLPPAAEAPARLHEAMRYAVFAGGKRLRPALVVLGARAAGGSAEKVLPAAAALELIHTYSLVHDDLPALDDDDLRRGRPTVHRRYDEATAILVGDALLTLGLTLLASEPAAVEPERRRAAVALVGRAIGTAGMIGGQAEDLEAERAWPEDAARALERIHRGKTAALIAAACELGALLAGADDALCARLAALGERLGLMFQIADDMLDVVGTTVSLGKTAGKDVRAHKLTYPALHGLARSRAELDRLRRETSEMARGLPPLDGLLESLIDFLARRDR